ncbi:hypothetical protein [Streptomyces cylindrosporus]|uniref:Secreted protein n=1 Tax=Streptomyces cylindrosporus TaxID=2927583 RepID=A0ABS9YFQ7_9ACTN|nr:hypothetical protein [Streptomyces cylindrosporus]MCI3276066.1 hypothetical protein [Streptomyces cylindrosporus]
MTWPAALPAALRVMRTAAGRRALQVVLVVGGLFALGFLCGEQAHAAEGAPVASSAEVVPVGPVVPAAVGDGVRSLADGVIGSLTGGEAGNSGIAGDPDKTGMDAPAQSKPTAPVVPPASAPAPAPAAPKPHAPKPHAPKPPAPRPAAPNHRTPNLRAPKPSADPITEALTGALSEPGADDAVLRPVTDQVVQVVQAVGDGVLRPVGGLVETVTDELGKATAQIPVLPTLPALPSLPTVPGLPSLPAQPGQTLPAPVTVPGGAAGDQTQGGHDGGRDAAAVVSGAAYGPGLGGDAGAAHGPAHEGGQSATGAGYAPVHQAPGGDPTGALDNHSAMDNGTPRHGDAHAVALSRRVPLRLLPGGAARTDAAGLRDRHRDIPVSPA